MSEQKQPLEKRAQNAILRHALMRWESAMVLAGTGLFTFLTAFDMFGTGAIPPWAVLLAGGAAYSGLAWSSFKDDKTNAEIVAGMLREDYNPREISDPRLQAYVNEALDYRTRITTQINEIDDTSFKIQLEMMASQFDDWIAEVYDLAGRLDLYLKQKRYLDEQEDAADKRIDKLVQRRLNRNNQDITDDIDQNLAALQQQLATIRSLKDTMKRAQLRLENTLTAMGTIYPQTMLLDAKDIDSSRYRRLQQDIRDEVDELADVLYAMDEVYASDE